MKRQFYLKYFLDKIKRSLLIKKLLQTQYKLKTNKNSVYKIEY